MPIKTQCACGAAFAAPDQLAGRQVKCPKCGAATRVPAAGAPASTTPQGNPPRPGRSAASTDPSVASLLDEVDLGGSKTGRRCPECRTDVLPDAILCIHCGMNLETGKRLTTKTVQAVNKEGPKLHGAAKAAATRAAEPPKAVLTLAKLLSNAGTIFLLLALGIVAYRAFQATQAQPNNAIDALIKSLTESGIYILLGFVAFAVVPFAVAGNLVRSGKAAGRILSIVMGIVAVPIIIGVLIIKLALTDEVSRFCQ